MEDEAEERFRRFAAAHLRSASERAVYAVVAGDRDGVWSAVEAARAAHISDHEADRVLRRFAAAGICEAVVVPGHGRRYRWHPTFDDLHGAEPPVADFFVDPVCGMRVRTDTPHVATEEHGQVFFCSRRCLVLWRVRSRRHTHGRDRR